MTLFGGHSVPLHRIAIMLRNTQAIMIQNPDKILRGSVAFLGIFVKLTKGLGIIVICLYSLFESSLIQKLCCCRNRRTHHKDQSRDSTEKLDHPMCRFQ